MAGMGEALGLIVAGAAGNAAGNRATDIREGEKAQLAADREMKLAKFQSDLRIGEQSKQNEFTAGESSKERDARQKLSDSDNASRMQIAQMQESGANARASMAQRGEDARLEKQLAARMEGKGDLVQSVNMLKDQDGNTTGQAMVTFKNGETKLVDSRDLTPEGGGQSANEKEAAEKRNSDAEAYAETRIKEQAGLFSSDAKDFKDYGGSRAKAKEFFKQEFLDGKGGAAAAGSTGGASDGDFEAYADKDPRSQPVSSAQQPATPAMSQEAQYIFNQVKQANPEASDQQILDALSKNEKYAKYFSR